MNFNNIYKFYKNLTEYIPKITTTKTNNEKNTHKSSNISELVYS